MSRAVNRLKSLAGAMLTAVGRPRPEARPVAPRKILVLHELLLGDVLMLAPLLSKLRQRYNSAEILVTARAEYASLFSGKPYGVRALPFSERARDALSALAPARGCDLAILPGENRYAVTAHALGAKWVIAFAGAKPRWKDRLVDELVAMPGKPAALADMFGLLAGDGEAAPYRRGDWPAPECVAFEVPSPPYAVLHVGAGSALRLWPPDRWRRIADEIAQIGVQVVLSAGPREQALVHAVDPAGRHRSYAGTLDLPQLWHLLAGARFAVTLDTGIAHLAKLTCTRTAVLFGPGSEVLFGKGRFWEANDFHAISRPGFPCRDQSHLFRRELSWVRRCNRTPAGCPRARCMEAIPAESVLDAVQVK